MAVHHLTECLGEKGIDVELAVGADFVPAMIDAARLDLSEYGTPWARERVRYGVATNENLVAGVAEALGVLPKDISGTFHLALGVNTFRYPIRHGTSGESIEQLRTLLAPGGRVVVIDMNDRFPYALKPRRRTRHGSRPFPITLGNSNLPSLDEY